MEKKKYVVPNMVIVELKHQTHLLEGSPDPDSEDGARRFDWDD